ncbi:C40 family peptidase [Solihabitans fulvus]|uniref:C40 family peptidase n=1 Tax=Solihabitans fulvus TaxID=1892852 RepID=UPI001CB7682C|nr:C40 family peptidase [Solihabitans fulvus]
MSLTPAPASADPAPPANASEALKKYNDLSQQSEKLAQDLLKAQGDLDAKNGELDKANNDNNQALQAEQQAKGDEEQFRGQVDQLTEASFEGARFNQLSALLVSSSQTDFLNRMSALGVLASDNKEALDRLSGAVSKKADAQKQTQDASQRAQDAQAAAAKLTSDINNQKKDVDAQAAQAKQAFNSLSASEKNTLNSVGDKGSVTIPTGDIGAVIAFAQAQLGKPYVYGSNGPASWDCSSLTQHSYAAAGIPIPRTSYAQATIGRSVSRSEVQAGDLLIYYSGQSHVALAIDNQRAIHASTEGVPVKIATIDSIGPINVIRRVVG